LSERTIFCTPTEKRDLQMVEALRDAVADGAVGEQRGEAAPAGVKQRGLAPDVEVALLLAGKARRRQILGRGARAHRDVDGIAAPATPRQLAVGARHLGGKGLRKFAVEERLPDRGARFGECCFPASGPVELGGN
jgi:hypothetical protein